MINAKIYDTATLYGVIRDERAMQPPLNYWLSLCFPEQINFTDEYVDFAKITSNRKLAPLVVPTAQGKPIYSAAERQVRVKPAYVKPKDPITATRMMRRQAGMGDLNVQQQNNPQARFNYIVAAIMSEHRRAIERRWEWLAAKAVIDGKVILEDEAYPRTIVDFGRDPAQTIVKTGGMRWGQAGVKPMRDIEAMSQQARMAPFGGLMNRVTIGANVWSVIRDDAEIRDLLKAENRQINGGLDLNVGIRSGLEVEYVGNLSANLQLYIYSDYYQEPDGTITPFMSPNDVVLTGPGIQGVRCFGAIQDFEANFQALEIFPSMWSEKDPSGMFIMNQSAPLMVPVNPNCSVKATVL